MPEIVNVIPGNPVTDEWGNAIRDRTVQRYTSISQRNTLHATPTAGDLAYLADSGAVEVFHSGSWRGFIPTGAVIPFAGATPPTGYLVCNGSAVSRTTYAGLFAAIGAAFGAGDGSTTFNIPDLRGRFPLGVAASGTGSTLGAAGGTIDHTHTGPSHTHTGGSHTHGMGTHTHTGPSHTHSTPAHQHLMLSHAHSFSDTSSGGSSGIAVQTAGAGGAAITGHTHTVSGTTGATTPATDGGGSGTTGSGGTGTTGATDPGDTAAGGTGATGAGGTGASGLANPPFLALNYLIRT